MIDDKRTAESYGSGSPQVATAQALDEFCRRCMEDGAGRNFFRQVVFQQ
jgi:hypothetical protein